MTIKLKVVSKDNRVSSVSFKTLLSPRNLLTEVIPLGENFIGENTDQEKVTKF